MENRGQQRKTDKKLKETDRQIGKMSARVDQTAQEVTAMCKRVDRVTVNVGGLNRSMGELIETLIAARLWEKFDGYPNNLKRVYQRVPVFDESNVTKTDINILLSNTEWCMAIEVKANLNRKEEVNQHLKRMTLIRKYPPAETTDKKLLGAMAGGVVDPDVRDYAQQNGFFVLELAGESVNLMPPPEGFTPRSGRVVSGIIVQ